MNKRTIASCKVSSTVFKKLSCWSNLNKPHPIGQFVVTSDMDLRHGVSILLIIIITSSASHAFADDMSKPWKITIKTGPGINNTSFWPSELHARQNDTILWINNDTTAHTVTSGILDHPTYVGKIFDSNTIAPGGNYSLKITDHMWSGYYYFCKIHPWMTGKIDVGVAYLGTSPDFNIETNKDAYYEGDDIMISGIVNNTNQITPVSIQIFNNNRDMVYQDKANLLPDYSFLYELKASSSIFKTDGDYKIKSMYGFPSTITDVNIAFNRHPPQELSLHSQSIPHWIKNDAKWWNDNKISDNDFINCIQFLIKKGDLSIQASNPSKINSKTIPSWIKNSMAEWVNDTSSDDKFISSISYMINHEIIKT